MATSGSEKPDKESEHRASIDSEYDSDPRTSADIRHHDRETIAAEEEAERLLTGDQEKSQDAGGLAHIFRLDEGEHKRSRRRQRRKDRESRSHNGENELLYKAEEGNRSSSAESSANSSEVDMGRMRQTHAKRKVCGLDYKLLRVFADIYAVQMLVLQPVCCCPHSHHRGLSRTPLWRIQGITFQGLDRV